MFAPMHYHIWLIPEMEVLTSQTTGSTGPTLGGATVSSGMLPDLIGQNHKPDLCWLLWMPCEFSYAKPAIVGVDV